MCKIILCFSFLFSLLFLNATLVQAQAACTDNMPSCTCENLGVTKMSADRSNIIACMLITPTFADSPTCQSSGGCVWKSTTSSEASSASGTVIGGGICHPNQDQSQRCPNKYTVWGVGKSNGTCTSGTLVWTARGSGPVGSATYDPFYVFATGFICLRD